VCIKHLNTTDRADEKGLSCKEEIISSSADVVWQ